MKQWVVMGNYESVGNAFVRALPNGSSEEYAKRVVSRMITNPSHIDRVIIGDAKSIWAEEIDSNKAWWNDNYD